MSRLGATVGSVDFAAGQLGDTLSGDGPFGVLEGLYVGSVVGLRVGLVVRVGFLVGVAVGL